MGVKKAAGMYKAPRRDSVGASVAAGALVLGCVLLLDLIPAVTARAAVPVLLLAELLVARGLGTGPALTASVVATLGYTTIFLPRVNLASDERWVALVNFAVSVVIVGVLAARAERRSMEAQAGQRENERLYKQLEGAFERATEVEAARRSEQVKATLLDALTHNLRTPLTAIKASVTALLGSGHWDADGALSTDQRRELLQVIDEESDRLNRFVQGLSGAGKPASDRALRQPVMVADLVSAALSRAGALTRGHRVQVVVDRDLPPINVDEAAVVEVLYILIDNATKYAPAGTEVRISAAREGTGHVYVEVIDEGPGIPSALRERVFDNFFRIEGREPTDPNRRGIGLGLPIARRLIEGQDGRIWIESPPHRKGTAVILMLPMISSPAPRAGSPEAAVAAS